MSIGYTSRSAKNNNNLCWYVISSYYDYNFSSMASIKFASDALENAACWIISIQFVNVRVFTFNVAQCVCYIYLCKIYEARSFSSVIFRILYQVKRAFPLCWLHTKHEKCSYILLIYFLDSIYILSRYKTFYQTYYCSVGC